MAVGLILQFAGTGRAEYEAVNAKLGIDPATGAGNWPGGMLSHTAGLTGDGSLVVIEIWESHDAQGRFMAERLGRAIQESGVTAAPQITWFDVISNNSIK